MYFFHFIFTSFHFYHFITWLLLCELFIVLFSLIQWHFLSFYSEMYISFSNLRVHCSFPSTLCCLAWSVNMVVEQCFAGAFPAEYLWRKWRRQWGYFVHPDSSCYILMDHPELEAFFDENAVKCIVICCSSPLQPCPMIPVHTGQQCLSLCETLKLPASYFTVPNTNNTFWKIPSRSSQSKLSHQPHLPLFFITPYLIIIWSLSHFLIFNIILGFGSSPRVDQELLWTLCLRDNVVPSIKLGSSACKTLQLSIWILLHAFLAQSKPILCQFLSLDT